jgi:hypothetical protein
MHTLIIKNSNPVTEVHQRFNSGYRPRGPGFDSRRLQMFWEAVGLERGLLSLVSTREYNWGATWKK